MSTRGRLITAELLKGGDTVRNYRGEETLITAVTPKPERAAVVLHMWRDGRTIEPEEVHAETLLTIVHEVPGE